MDAASHHGTSLDQLHRHDPEGQTDPRPTPDPLDQTLHMNSMPYLQLLEFLARQKTLASRLEEHDALRDQLLSLLLKPRDHTCLEKNLGRGKVSGPGYSVWSTHQQHGHHLGSCWKCKISYGDGFHHVVQASLELLTSGEPPASASQSAEITGVSHYAQLDNSTLMDDIIN
ncbi:hypothetical protein AAY473_004137 [Plecturocebus cupreus]